MIKSNWDGSKTLSIDGTGSLASVDCKVAQNLHKFIVDNIITEGAIIDFGAGQGYFQKYFEENTNFDVWSIEGYSGLDFKANKDKWLLSNLGTKLTQEYHKKFDLVVSFECIEHIHKTEQEVFWENVFLCSNKALIGIHTENEEHDAHCFIRNTDWWVNFFESKGYKYKILGHSKDYWPVWPEAQCSLFAYLEVQ